MDTLDSLVSKVNSKLENSHLFYLTNDPERALGLERLIKNFIIVHIDKNEYLDDLAKYNIDNFCLAQSVDLPPDFFRSSVKLIRSSQFLTFFHNKKGLTNYFQTFKISPAFEKAVKELDGCLINTSSVLNRKFEDKISQFEILSQLPVSLPRSKIIILGDQKFEDLSKEFGNGLGNGFVLQFARGHTGSSTVFVKSKDEFDQLQVRFSQRQVKVSEFIKGSAYTVNCCITSKGVFFGGLSKQITGVSELTPIPGATVGNDWLDRSDLILGLEKLNAQITIIGNKMHQDGYAGLFGLDIIFDTTGQHYFIEINARQPASIPMYTKIQLLKAQVPLSLLHLAEFLGIDYNIDVEKYNKENMQPCKYSQVFIRALTDSVIKTELRSGIYRLQGDNAGFDPVKEQKTPNSIFIDEARNKSLILHGEGYCIEDFENTKGMLLLTQSLGRIIKLNSEFARLQLEDCAIQINGELKPWIVEVLRAVYFYQS